MTIGRQLLLDWDRRDRDIAALRDHLAATDLLSSDCALLCALASLDQRRDAETYCRKSKRELGLVASLTPTTVLRSLARLATNGLAVVDTAAGRIEILVDWHAVWSLARSADPATRIERLRARVAELGQVGEGNSYTEPPVNEGGPGWSGVVRGGPPPRTCLKERSKIRGSVDPVNRDTCAVQRTSGPRPTRSDRQGTTPGPPRPWARNGGYSDRDLVHAVQEGNLDPIRHLWREALALEWIIPSDDATLRWLTCVHHCATTPGIRSRMGLLVSLVRGGLDTRRIRHAHEDWAQQVLRARHSSPQLAERVAVCD